MDEYSVYLYTKSKKSKPLVETLIRKGLQLGFAYEHRPNCKTHSIDANQIIELLSKEKASFKAFFKKDRCKYFSIFGGDTFKIEADYTTKTWLNEFKYSFDVDHITVTRIMLDLTASFLLDDFYIQAPEEWETFSELKKGKYIENYNNDLSQFNIPNSITTKFRMGKSRMWDALDITDMAKKNKYTFYDLNNEKLDYDQATIKIFSGVSKGLGIEKLLIESQGHYSQIIFNNGLVTLALKEPYKMKTVEGQTGIDIAYYLKILLNLAEPFGFYELECNIKQID